MVPNLFIIIIITTRLLHTLLIAAAPHSISLPLEQFDFIFISYILNLFSNK